MGFSSITSFGLAIVMAVAGIASIVRAGRRSELLFSSIPLILAVQQLAEGLIWLGMDKSSLSVVKRDLSYTYLFIIESVWPVLVPLSLLLLERNRIRKTLLLGLLSVGIFTSVYLAFYLLTYGVSIRAEGYTILYEQHLRSPDSVMGSLPYLLAGILPFWISGIERMWWIGAVTVIFFIPSMVLSDGRLLSVWSFCAVIISALVYYIITIMQQHSKTKYNQNFLT